MHNMSFMAQMEIQKTFIASKPITGLNFGIAIIPPTQSYDSITESTQK